MRTCARVRAPREPEPGGAAALLLSTQAPAGTHVGVGRRARAPAPSRCRSACPSCTLRRRDARTSAAARGDEADMPRVLTCETSRRREERGRAPRRPPPAARCRRGCVVVPRQRAAPLAGRQRRTAGVLPAQCCAATRCVRRAHAPFSAMAPPACTMRHTVERCPSYTAVTSCEARRRRSGRLHLMLSTRLARLGVHGSVAAQARAWKCALHSGAP